MDTLSRRKFLKATGLTGTALCLGYIFPAGTGMVKVLDAAEDSASVDLNAWVRIDTTGKVTLFCHRAEMGQGAFQAVPQIIAEELEVHLHEIEVLFAQGHPKKYGSQVTGGSSTVRTKYKDLLKLGASAREMLIEAACKKWGVPRSECFALGGQVIHRPTGKKLHYGELVQEASKLEAPQEVKLKPRSEYKLIGKPLRRLDTPVKTNGAAVFGIDKKLPGMLYASVERSPRLRGVIKSFDDSAALKVPGVKHVFKVQMKVFNTLREGVAVVATTTWAAMQGRRALKIEWDDAGFEHISTDDIHQRHRAALAAQEGLSFRKVGDPDAVLQQATQKLDVVYETPYQAHFCMEPLNCVAHYQEDKIEIWGPIQGPDWIQRHISAEMGLPKEKVMVNMTFLGGGFGRKAFTDYTHEAAVISKEINAPVQVVWTREDDATQGPFRPGMSYRCEGAVANGEISAFKVRMAGQNIGHWDGGSKEEPNDSITEGFLPPYFDSIKNLNFADVPFETPIPVMWWRSVYASTNGFAFESFIDELAAQAGKDPMTFRRQHLMQDARTQRLLDKLEEMSGWKKRGKGYGVAITECFASTVGHVVKVSKNSEGGIRIDKVWTVMDCGWYVNPDTIHAQIEGSIVMALGAATKHETLFEAGKAVQRNFYNYPMPMMADMPEIEVHIMENNEYAGGVGEPALPPFAPALTNAIFDLTGKRIRKLPFDMSAV